MLVKCPHCGSELSGEEIKAVARQLVENGVVSRKRSKNTAPRADKGGSHRTPKEYKERKPEAESELKKRTSAENGRKGGRPKGSPNKAPRADIGIKRGLERAIEGGTMYTVDSVRMSESSFRKKLSEMDGGKTLKWETIRKESQVHKVLRLTDEDGNTHTFRISKISV